jgi:hypothetical protein
MQMRRAGHVVIAVTKDTIPPTLFLTNAAALGHIWSTNDSDGVLRRAQAFIMVRRWDSAFRQVEADPDYGVDLRLARVERNRIVLPRRGGPDIAFPLDANGNFDRTDFGGDKLPAGTSRYAKAFTEERVWHMGIVLAALQLGLDLDHAEVGASPCAAKAISNVSFPLIVRDTFTLIGRSLQTTNDSPKKPSNRCSRNTFADSTGKPMAS